MAGFTDYLEGKLLDHVFGASSYSAPATLYIGLATDVYENGGVSGEPSGSNYARVSHTNNAANWPTAGGTGTKQNGAAFTFNEATGSWGTVDMFFISDASSGNTNTLAYGTLSSAKTIDSGDTPKFNASDITITLD